LILYSSELGLKKAPAAAQLVDTSRRLQYLVFSRVTPKYIAVHHTRGKASIAIVFSILLADFWISAVASDWA